MTRFAAVLLLVAAVAACSADAAPPTRVVRLAGLPETLVAGQRWVARVTVRPAAGPSLRATSGARTVTVRAAPTQPGRYTATLRLPTAGIWRLAALVRGRSFPLGRVRVLASYPLALPAQILALDDRSLLVVERQGRDRILRVDAGTGRFSVVTTRIPSPWGLARDANGRVLVVSDTGNGRVIRIDPTTRATSVVASGLASPLGAIETADGDLLVVEFDSGRLLRIGDGEVVTRSLRKPYALTQSADGSIYVVESGNVGRPSGGIARVAGDGAVVRLRLLPDFQAFRGARSRMS